MNGFDATVEIDRHRDAIPMHGKDTAVLSVGNGCEFSVLRCTRNECCEKSRSDNRNRTLSIFVVDI